MVNAFLFIYHRYEVDSGENICRGSALNLKSGNAAHLYAMIGADDTLYWVKFTEDEFQNEPYLSKTVRLSEFFTLWRYNKSSTFSRVH